MTLGHSVSNLDMVGDFSRIHGKLIAELNTDKIFLLFFFVHSTLTTATWVCGQKWSLPLFCTQGDVADVWQQDKKRMSPVLSFGKLESFDDLVMLLIQESSLTHYTLSSLIVLQHRTFFLGTFHKLCYLLL